MVEPNTKKILALLKRAVKTGDPKLLDYQQLVGYNQISHHINKNSYIEFLSMVYDYWYKNVFKKLPTSDIHYSDYWYNMLKVYIASSNKEINSYYKDLEFFEFVFDDFNHYAPIKIQGEYFCQIWSKYLSVDRIKNLPDKFPTVRLYLEIDMNNIVDLSTAIVKYIIDNNLPLTFKFSLNERNDSMVFYTDYDYANQIVDMIHNLKIKYPHMFQNCEVTNPLLAKLDDYIGFGEEPKLFGSYNQLRTEALVNSYKELRKIYQEDKTALTDEKIIEVFAEKCRLNNIDINHFHLNTKDRYWEE